MVAGVLPGDVELVRVREDLGVAVGAGQQRRPSRTRAASARPRPRCRPALMRPVSSTGGSTRSTSSTALGQRSARSASSLRCSGSSASSAMPLPSRLTVVSKPAASTSPAVDLQLVVGEADAVLLGGDELAEQVVARVLAQAGEVLASATSSNSRSAASTLAELAPGEPEVEARRGRGAEPEHLLAVLLRDAEDLRDDGDGQEAAVRRDEVDRAARVDLVEQVVGDLLGALRAASRPPGR